MYHLSSYSIVLAYDLSSTPETQTTSVENVSEFSIAQDMTNSLALQGSSNPLATENDVDSSQESSDNIINVSINKTWSIQFNQPIDIASAKSNVKIIDKKTNEEIPINISLSKDKFCIDISTASPYNADNYYLLSVDNGLMSGYKRNLKTPFNMTFKTNSIIASIDDIKVSINQGDKYTLPSEVTANMSNGEKKLVNITWDKLLSSLDVPGNYVYYGSVEGYDEKVNLSLTITDSNQTTSSQTSSSSNVASSPPPNNTSSSSNNTSSSSSSTYSTCMWIWHLEDEVEAYGGIDNLISKLKSLGINNVCIKYHEGSSPTGGGTPYRDDFLKYVQNFKNAGFKVGTWGYNYFNDIQSESNLIIEALNNSDYYVFDPEVDVSGKEEQAEEVCSLVRSQCPNAVIGYSSFPIASYHQDIPYSVFNKYCDFAAPQCYWGEMQWSVTSCMDRMIQDYKDYGLDKPIYPLIQTYNVNYSDYTSYLTYKFKNTGLWSFDDIGGTCEDFLINEGDELNN